MFNARLLVLGFSVVLGGCNIGSFARVNPNTVASYGIPDPKRPATAAAANAAARVDNSKCPFTRGLDDTTDGAINLDCFRFPGDSSGLTAYAQASGSSGSSARDTARAEFARNRLAAILMKHADDVCVLEKGRIVGREGALNFGLGSATTAFSTVSTIVGGDLAKSILSGAAAFTSGVRGHAAESFYRNQVTQAINAAMDGEREKVRTELATRRKDKLADFTVDDMIRLVNQYHQACSYERGLQLLIKAAVNQEGFDDIARTRTAAASLASLEFQVAAIDRRLGGKNVDSDEKTQLLARKARLQKQIDKALGLPEEESDSGSPTPTPGTGTGTGNGTGTGAGTGTGTAAGTGTDSGTDTGSGAGTQNPGGGGAAF